jgi:hypothetical protein
MTKWRSRPRILLYMIAFSLAAALDAVTPLRFADWLLQVILVWTACLWGSRREALVVAAIGSAVIIGGFFTSPAAGVPLLAAAVNRLAAIGIIWAMVHVANRRRAAEEAHQRDVAHIKVLQGLLPICASCKAIASQSGEWHTLEHYFLTNSDARVTHGLCPTCAAKYREQLERFKQSH